ncbi:hypothetical protein K0504_11150 [Neiella marina]|uniref:Uncharacterized protein n=1 Tax=Neiella holothuriorum TaxID=2870530 RepID=A0ABS7EH32_9GAMM|nr:hypothetical protein [Neiella holothuriorum]MBW8191595.1 hypothetical protein [Neiella holothuriorum]
MNISGLNFGEQIASKLTSLWSANSSEQNVTSDTFDDVAGALSSAQSTATVAIDDVEVEAIAPISMSELFSGESWSNAFVQLQQQLTGSFDNLTSLSDIASLTDSVDVADELVTPDLVSVSDQIEQGVSLANVDIETDAITDGELFTQAYQRLTNNLFDGGSIGWDDAVDMVNPMQHVPLVSDAYSALSGDDQGYVTSLVGSAVLGASPVTMAATAADIGIEVLSGKNIAGHAWQLAKSAYQTVVE